MQGCARKWHAKGPKCCFVLWVWHAKGPKRCFVLWVCSKAAVSLHRDAWRLSLEWGSTAGETQSLHMSHPRATTCPTSVCCIPELLHVPSRSHCLSYPRATTCPTRACPISVTLHVQRRDCPTPQPQHVPCEHPPGHMMALWRPAQCTAGRGGHGYMASRAQGHSAGDTKGQPQPHTPHTQP